MSATATPPVDLARCLQVERDALKQCVDILSRERQLLMDGDVDALADLCVRKSMLLDSVHGFSALRERYLVASGLSVDHDVMNTLLHDTPNLRELWDESLEWARQAANLNNVNGELIDVRINHNRQALTVMRDAANAHTIYGNDGRMQYEAAGRAIGLG